MQNKTLEEFIFNILESKKKSFFVYFITFLLLFIAILFFPTNLVKAKMLPSKNSNSFSIYLDLKTNSSLKQTKEVSLCISKYLMKNKEVNNISIFLAQGQALDFAGMVKGSALKNSQNQAEINVNLTKAENRDISSYNLIHKIRAEIQNNCTSYEALIKFIELPAGPPVLAALVAEIYGGNTYQNQKEFAKKVSKVLKMQKSLVDIDIIADKTYKKFSLILDHNKIIRSQISIKQVKEVLFLAFKGINIAALNKKDSQNQINLFLRLDDTRLIQTNTKEGLESKLSSLKLMNIKGEMISINNFIRIVKNNSQTQIYSKDLSPIVSVIAQTDNDSQIYPLLDARNYFLNDFDKNYQVKKSNLLNLTFINKKTGEKFELIWDGELRVTIDTFIDLGLAFIAALILIYFLMLLYYKSFKLSSAIVLSSFVSIIGVIFAHYIMDVLTKDTFYLTATSLIGFIALIGINSRNSTLIIDFAKLLYKENNMSSNRAIAKSTATRAKAILLTVLTMVFASALLTNDAVFGGLGIALMGGTLMSFLVSLFFVPVSIKNSLKDIL